MLCNARSKSVTSRDLYNDEKAPEECDATGFHSSNAAWFMHSILRKNQLTILYFVQHR